MSRAPALRTAPSSRGALLLAVSAYFVIVTFVPFGRTLLFPMSLFATWVHEMGHGLMALLVGGHFEHLDIYRDGSGLAFTAAPPPSAPTTELASLSWQWGLICAAGPLATPVVGALLLGVSRGPRRARVVLVALALVLVTSLFVWVRTLAGWLALPAVTAVVLHFALRAGPRSRMVFAQFVGIVLAMDSVTRRDYLFVTSAVVQGVTRTSDIAFVAACFGGSNFAWGVIVSCIVGALLVLGLILAWRDQPDVVVVR